jgi:protein tyrosine phosphatase (PTP) superfamily phosphohydrolase (DUF442 family)
LERYHIRTIINLRGANPDAAWYDAERALAARQGVRHFDIPVDSVSPPTVDEFKQLLAILDAPDGAPALIHCQSGVNRTGIVSAVCVLALEDDDQALGNARHQFSLLYGSLPGTGSVRGGQVFLDRYEKWLSDQGLKHNRERFRRWASEVRE